MYALLIAWCNPGMQGMDRQTSKALLEFSYNLALGDMNEAHKVSIEQIVSSIYSKTDYFVVNGVLWPPY